MSYRPLHDKSEESSQSAGDSERLLSENLEAQQSSHSSTKARFQIQLWLKLSVACLLSGIIFGLGAWVGSLHVSDKDAVCLRHVQKWSPIQAEVDPSYHLVRFNGSFMKKNAYRGPAGPETDAAWEALGINYRSLRVPTSEAPRSGLLESQVQIDQKYGGGFPANVEGLHHLHCLNLLRQSLYYNIDYYRAQGKGAFINSENIVEHHVSHCLDIIRQQLMCTPDTGLLGQIWWNLERPMAFVDFNTEHKCKNYEAIRQWAQARQIDENVPEDFLKPPRVGDVLEHLP